MKTIKISTKGHYDMIDISDKVSALVKESGIKDGIVFIFAKGSTVALTTMEYEEGFKKDLIELFERIAPENADYHHHQKWGDHNGAAHLKSALLKTNMNVPIKDGELLLGAWQQIVLIDFDEKPREREILVNILTK
jgi:secondary thiamine-phosphate synthase enzyme